MRSMPDLHNRWRSAFARGRLPGLVFLLLAGGFLGSYAQAASCQAIAPPTLEVDASSDEVREVFDTTEAEIRRIAAARGLQPHWPGLGAYAAELRYVANIKEEAEAERGSYCAIPTAVHLVIVLKRRVIHLARELQENPCLSEAVRQHAWRHARADEDALKQLPPLTEQLREALARLPPVRGETELAAKSAATTAVRATIGDFLDRLDDTRAKLNLTIDMPEAIDRLRAQCGPGRVTGTSEPSPTRVGG
jgi:hypothetical protein